MKDIPGRIKRLFWDADKSGVDLNIHRFYIIKRILDYGIIEDVKWMQETYTPEEIIEVVKRGRGFSRKSAYFWAAYFNIQIGEIECLKEPYRRRLRPF
jgi:hypothetical protein